MAKLSSLYHSLYSLYIYTRGFYCDTPELPDKLLSLLIQLLT